MGICHSESLVGAAANPPQGFLVNWYFSEKRTFSWQQTS